MTIENATAADATPVDNRKPVTWLNYCGDQSHIVNDGPKGPNLGGELLYPVTAEYDADNDVTRVGFSYIAPPAPAQA